VNFDPLALASQMETLAKHLRRDGVAARRLACDWSGPLRAAGGPGRGSKGDHADPTYAAASALLGRRSGSEDPSGYWDALKRLAGVLSGAGAELDGIVVQLGRASRNQHLASSDPERKPTLGAGDCAACGEWVTGAAEDRLRSGYCENDYRRWVRAGRPDRAAFEHATRAEGAA
jgi:hypothetical protein